LLLLEITENSLISDLEGTLETIHRLSDLGDYAGARTMRARGHRDFFHTDGPLRRGRYGPVTSGAMAVPQKAASI
jgi:hypothetical protein